MRLWVKLDDSESDKLPMRSTLFLFYFFLSACKNAPVELSSAGLMGGSPAQFSITSRSYLNSSFVYVSFVSTPALKLNSIYNDLYVDRLDIFTDSACVSTSLVASLTNITDSATTGSAFSDGQYNLFFKPHYVANEMNLTAICAPAGLVYKVDTVRPNYEISFAVPTSSTASRAVNVVGCSNETGASHIILSEMAVMPAVDDASWQTCTSTKNITVYAAPTGTSRTLYSATKDEAGNISYATTTFQVTAVSSPPVIKLVGPYERTIARGVETSIFFANSGGDITRCATDLVLPAGLTISYSTAGCSIGGTPTVEALAQTYTMLASGNGTSTESFRLRVAKSSIANWGGGAGPDATHLTQFNATVHGGGITHYRIKVGNATSTNCADLANYGSWVIVSDLITSDIYEILDGTTVKLCLLGKTATEEQLAADATVFTWVKNPKIQLLSSILNRAITLDDQPSIAGSNFITTRSFDVGGAGGNVTCGNFCQGVRLEPSSTYEIFQNVPPNGKVHFKLDAMTTSGSIRDSSFTFDGDTYTIKVRSRASACTVSTKVFVSKFKVTGNAGGLAGADSLCTSEANSHDLLGDWLALLPSDGTSPISTVSPSLRGPIAGQQYCDAVNGNTILDANHNFTASFSQFLGGVRTNGGSLSEWEYIVNAPRFIKGTAVWNTIIYTANSCLNWTSSSNDLSAYASDLTNEALSTSSTFHLTELVAPKLQPCSEARHVICYTKPPP